MQRLYPHAHRMRIRQDAESDACQSDATCTDRRATAMAMAEAAGGMAEDLVAADLACLSVEM